MIELIIGLIASVSALIAFAIYMIRKNGRLNSEKKSLEAAFEAINNARDFIDKQVEREVEQHEDNENSISNRNYFD